MLITNLFYAAIGMLLGFLAGLGVGGGSLLMLWLTLYLDYHTANAQIINLLFFLTSAGSVTLIRLKKGTLQLRVVFPGILAGCLLAVISTLLGKILPQELLRKMLGILFLVAGVKELFYRPRNAK